MIWAMTSRSSPFREEQEEALRKATTAYRRARTRAEQIMADARRVLADQIREAYADGQGLKKSDILRAIDHEWSRTWVDQTVRRNLDRDDQAQQDN